MIRGSTFGSEFVYTHGPLGCLLVRTPVHKAAMLLYDLFVLGSLLAIYRGLLPRRPRTMDILVLFGLAVATRNGLFWTNSAAALFTVLCYWLWRCYNGGGAAAISGVLIAAVVLFFGKINYGLIVVGLLPAYAVGLLLFGRRAAGTAILLGLPFLILCGAIFWHVDLAGYWRSGLELVAGYYEAMPIYLSESHYRVAAIARYVIAWLFMLAIVAAAFAGRRRLPWRAQAMLLLLVGLAAMLLFKNAYCAHNETHVELFSTELPLLLAVWFVALRGTELSPIVARLRLGGQAAHGAAASLASRIGIAPGAAAVGLLLRVSVVYALAVLTASATINGVGELAECTPWQYFRQVVEMPWREDEASLRESFLGRFPQATLPAEFAPQSAGQQWM